MNKIEKLIARLCPDGVEFKELEKIAVVSKGKQLNKELLFAQGKYPVLNGGINPSGYWDEYNFDENKIAISQGGASAGFVNFLTKKFWAGAHCYVVLPNEDIVVNRYLYFYLKSRQESIQNSKLGAGIPGLNKKEIEQLVISIPPLAIQEEIVKILDNFTELEAELEARKKQYEYYRDKLLPFDDDEVEWKELGKVCQISRGRVISKEYLITNAGEYPVYSSQTANHGIFGCINTYDYSGEYVTWTTDGANAGSVFYRNGKFSITNVCGLVKPKKNSLDTKYLSYILGTTAKSYVSSGMGNPK